MRYLSFFFQAGILSYFFAINSVYSLLNLMAFIEVRRQARRVFIDDYAYVLRSKLAPGVSILVPSYNEENIIVDNIHSLLTSKYPQIEVVVVNDGSTDGTLAALIDAFTLVKVSRVLRDTLKTQAVREVYKSPDDPRLTVIDKENGGKADSLNVALNVAVHPYILTIDADVILAEDALLRIMKPILDDPRHVVAGGGIVRIVNECVVKGGQVVAPRLPKQPLVLFQIVEYMRAFTAGRAGYSRLGSLVIVSGAFGIYSANVVRGIGGFYSQTVGEDLEILLRIHRYLRYMGRKDYRVFYSAFPICWTEAPATFRVLGRQRSRWHQGLSEALWRHRAMILNPRYGRIGLFAMPVYLLFEWWGPLMESAGYIFFLYLLIFWKIDFWYFLPFLTVAILWGMLLSMTSVAMQEVEFRWFSRWRSLLKLIAYATAENLGYRQLTVIWRIQGLLAWLLKRKGWGKMPRRGFHERRDVDKSSQ